MEELLYCIVLLVAVCGPLYVSIAPDFSNVYQTTVGWRPNRLKAVSTGVRFTATDADLSLLYFIYGTTARPRPMWYRI